MNILERLVQKAKSDNVRESHKAIELLAILAGKVPMVKMSNSYVKRVMNFLLPPI